MNRETVGFLFSIYFSAAAFSFPLAPVKLCERLLSLSIEQSARVDLQSVLLSANAKYPQIIRAIETEFAMTYLTTRLGALEWVREPTPEEIEQLGKSMDKLHKGCRVAYRTRGHPQSDGIHLVTPERLKSHIQDTSTSSLVKVWKTARLLTPSEISIPSPLRDFIGAENRENRKYLARSVDDFFLDGKRPELSRRLRLVGECLSLALRSSAMSGASHEHLSFIRDPSHHPSVNESAAAQSVELVLGTLRSQILEELRHKLPELAEPTRAEIAALFTQD